MAHHPAALYNETHQARTAAPTSYESLLGDSIERAFGAGIGQECGQTGIMAVVHNGRGARLGHRLPFGLDRGPKRGQWWHYKRGIGGDILELVAIELLGLPSAASDFPRVLEETARLVSFTALENYPELQARKETRLRASQDADKAEAARKAAAARRRRTLWRAGCCSISWAAAGSAWSSCA